MSVPMALISVATMLLALVGFVPRSFAAGQLVDAVDTTSIVITHESGPNTPAHTYERLKMIANWSLPDITQHSGDYFTLKMPEQMTFEDTQFPMLGKGDDTEYGMCVYTAANLLLTCTFNDNVNNKNNVAGDVWLEGTFNEEYAGETVPIEVNGHTPAIDVDLPGTGGIGTSPNYPHAISKEGWFDATNKRNITWRIVVPGDQVVGYNQITIHDAYGMDGINLTLVDQKKIRVTKVKNECWNKQTAPGCLTDLYGANTPNSLVQVVVDDVADTVTATIPGPFEAGYIYSLLFTVHTDTDIAAGSEFFNSAMVNQTNVSKTITKRISGGASGSGDTVGHLDLTKTIDGVPVPPGTMYTVNYSYTYQGNEVNGSVDLASDGTLSVLRNLPNGVEVTLTEAPTMTAGIEYGDPTFSGDGVVDGGDNSRSAKVTVVGEQHLAVTLSNPTTASMGTFSVAKQVRGDNAAGFANSQFTVTYHCDDADGTNGTIQVTGDGTATASGVNLPVGTKCTIGEDPASAGREGYSVETAVDTPTVTISKDAVPVVTITNTYTRDMGTFTVGKIVSGDAKPLAPRTFSFTYVCGDRTGTFTLSDNEVKTVPDVPTGECTITETDAAVANTQMQVSISVDGTVVQGNEASFTVAKGATVSIVVENTYQADRGSFQVLKTVTVSGGQVDADKPFTLTYDCTDSIDQSHSTGTLVVKADGVAVAPEGLALPIDSTCVITEDADAAQVSGFTLTVPEAQTITITDKDAVVTTTFENSYTAVPLVVVKKPSALPATGLGGMTTPGLGAGVLLVTASALWLRRRK